MYTSPVRCLHPPEVLPCAAETVEAFAPSEAAKAPTTMNQLCLSSVRAMPRTALGPGTLRFHATLCSPQLVSAPKSSSLRTLASCPDPPVRCPLRAPSS